MHPIEILEYLTAFGLIQDDTDFEDNHFAANYYLFKPWKLSHQMQKVIPSRTINTVYFEFQQFLNNFVYCNTLTTTYTLISLM